MLGYSGAKRTSPVESIDHPERFPLVSNWQPNG
jgi:hypothetical protein